MFLSRSTKQQQLEFLIETSATVPSVNVRNSRMAAVPEDTNVFQTIPMSLYFIYFRNAHLRQKDIISLLTHLPLNQCIIHYRYSIPFGSKRSPLNMPVIPNFTERSWRTSNEGNALQNLTRTSTTVNRLPSHLWNHIKNFLKPTSILVTCGRTGCIHLVSHHHRITKIITPLRWASGGIWSMAYDEHGSNLAVGYYNGSIVIINLSSTEPRLRAVTKLEKDNTPLFLKFTRKGELLIVGTQRGDILILNEHMVTTTTFRRADLTQGQREPWCLREINADELFAVGTDSGDIVELNVSNLKTKVVFQTEQGVTCMDVNVKKTMLAVGTSGAVVYILAIRNPPTWDILMSVHLPDFSETWAIRFANLDKLLFIGNKHPEASYVVRLEFRVHPVWIEAPHPGWSVQLGVPSTITSIDHATESGDVLLSTNDGGIYKINILDCRNAIALMRDTVYPTSRYNLCIPRPSDTEIHKRSRDFGHFNEIWCATIISN